MRLCTICIIYILHRTGADGSTKLFSTEMVLLPFSGEQSQHLYALE